MNQQDSVGRSALIAIATGALFAVFVLVIPRLVASTQTAQSEPSLAPMVAASHMTNIVHASSQTPTTTPPTTPTTSPTTIPASTPTTEAPSHTTTTEAPRPRVESGVQDGTITMTASLTPPRDGKGGEVLRDGDEIVWTVTVSASEELWGIYVYLEGAGHVPCDTKHLEEGDTATCVITDVVHDYDEDAEIWVDAWTADRWVTDTIFPSFTVAP